MGVLILAQLAAENLRSAVGNDLVGVHVEADTGSSLKNINHKGVVPLAILNFFGGLDDRVGSFRIDQSQIAVGLGGCLLHHGDGAYQGRMGMQSADGEVLDGANGLNAIVNVSGN